MIKVLIPLTNVLISFAFIFVTALTNRFDKTWRIATKAKLEVIKHAEAESASLKSKLDESQKLNAMQTQKLTKMKE